jgi:hypothetical protein
MMVRKVLAHTPVCLNFDGANTFSVIDNTVPLPTKVECILWSELSSQVDIMLWLQQIPLQNWKCKLSSNGKKKEIYLYVAR